MKIKTSKIVKVTNPDIFAVTYKGKLKDNKLNIQYFNKIKNFQTRRHRNNNNIMKDKILNMCIDGPSI